MEVIGKIKKIDETKTYGASGFRKREVVITTDEQYPQMLLIEFVQDKCDLLDSYQVGQDVKISINLRGREWTSPQGEVRYFNTLDAWRIEKVAQGMPQGGPSPMDLGSEPAPAAGSSADSNEEEDDLPF